MDTPRVPMSKTVVTCTEASKFQDNKGHGIKNRKWPVGPILKQGFIYNWQPLSRKHDFLQMESH